MRIIRTTAVLAFLTLPFLLPAMTPAAPAEAQKAKSIDELAKMYDSTGCKECHEEIYKDWEKSLHARSIYGTGRTAATIKTTVTVGLMGWKHSGVKKPEDVENRHLAICTKCHLPQLADATDDVAKEIVKNVNIFMEPKSSDDAKHKAELLLT